jgi:lipoprotein-releasing system permease protein
MNGFNLTIRSRMLSVEPHLVILQKTIPTQQELADMTKIVNSMSKSGVDRIERFETQDMILRSVDGVFSSAIAKGYDSESLYQMQMRVWQSLKRETAAPQKNSSELKGNELILGVDLARGMGVFEGDEVIVVPPETLLLPKGEIPRLQKFKVKSLLNTQMPEFDSKFMYYNIDLVSPQFRSLTREAGYEVRLKYAYEADQVKEKLKAKGIEAQTWGERDTSLFFALKLESYAMTLFLTLAVLITSFSIVTVMVLLMSQKRQDIGMLMAMGLSIRNTRVVFLKVGLLLSYLGILAGVAIGALICFVLEIHPMELLPDIYTDSTLPAKLTWGILSFVLGMSSLVAILGSALPVWRYVLGNPADSLRRNSPT